MNSFSVLLSGLLLCTLLGGCGQKGPLYLPQPDAPVEETSTADQP